MTRQAKTYLIIVLLGLCAISSTAVAGRLDGSLQALSNQSSVQDSIVGVIVFFENSVSMRDQVTLSASYQQMDRAGRLKMVSSRLRSDLPTKDNAVAQYLAHYSVTPIFRHWIVRSIAAKIPASALKGLSSMAGVDQVIRDVNLELVTPVSVDAAPAAGAVASELTYLGVPTLWQRGLTGKGRLVCSFDTGVEGTHPALAGKWRGNHAPLSASFYSVARPDTTPYDNAGHGTHTMGVMVGSNGADSFGVAPGAEWINAAVIDQGSDLSTTISDILSAFEWAMDPDGDTTTTDDVPDVILNSWGLPTLQPSALAPCSTIFWQAIDNVEAAGIVTIFAAGNEGRYGAMTIRNPANRASTPLNAFCVGAIGLNGVVADFSSRGPSSCDTSQIKPEVVAPGLSIRSSYKGGTYSYMSGTSMAAPYIAGLVALCRQYNPDATVDQIKWAIINSARDMGTAGEDNDYGYGVPDASRLPDFLPAPKVADFSLASQLVLDNGLALPGTQIGLQLSLTNSAGNIEHVIGRISSSTAGAATIVQNQADFAFGVGGTSATNTTPFLIQLSSTLINGVSLPFTLLLSTPSGQILDSLTLFVTVGHSAPGSIVSVSTGSLELAISDFGQYGFAPNSVYNLGSTGFTFGSSPNLLYEAGIIVGRNSLQTATAVRGETGQFRVSDFRTKQSQSLATFSTDPQGGVHHATSMTDAAASIQVPTTVHQEIVDYPFAGDDDYIIFSYYLVNSTLENQSGLHFGFLADFDLSSGSDQLGFSANDRLVYQHGPSGTWVGITALSGSLHFSSLNNGASKRGITASERLALLTAQTSSVDTATTGDLMLFVNSDAMNIAVGDSSRVAFALVVGNSYSEMLAAARRVRERFDSPTGVDDHSLLPGSFKLAQNYPNPFNPSTRISFELGRTADVSLIIYNTLGQQVRTLVSGLTAAGSHSVLWDGLDPNGSPVAAGVYFYRLTADGTAQSRKMLLLK